MNHARPAEGLDVRSIVRLFQHAAIQEILPLEKRPDHPGGHCQVRLDAVLQDAGLLPFRNPFPPPVFVQQADDAARSRVELHSEELVLQRMIWTGACTPGPHTTSCPEATLLVHRQPQLRQAVGDTKGAIAQGGDLGWEGHRQVFMPPEATLIQHLDALWLEALARHH